MLAPNLHVAYTLGPDIDRPAPAPYDRSRNDPGYRPLRIYTVDPTVPKLEGAVALIEVPYEPLLPGPVGRLLCIENHDQEANLDYRRASLDDPAVLIRNGYEPSQTDPRFHQQMVYAVCSNVYAAFRKALGRQLRWGPGVNEKLRIYPHAGNERNAYYDEKRGELRFGYYKADDDPTDNTLPGGYVFTCLSHDVIAHEVTHALLDGLRAHFSRPSGPDVVAFHEAFADLVALFQRFSYKDVVRNAVRKARGEIARADYLTDLARQIGHTSGHKAALRSAIDTDTPTGLPEQMYDPELDDPHSLGAVLVAAVFDAFLKIYRAKTERYIRLATGGTGILPPGEISHDLQEVLAERASKLAGQFLAICIRAIDYCPPVGLTFGDYLRALITADRDLVPEDRWDYRGALIEAFRRRKIYPRGVASLSEDSLLWRPPRIELSPVSGLSFARLRFRDDPGSAPSRDELRRQGCALGEYLTWPEHLEELGLVAPGDARLAGDHVGLPCVHSIRPSRRIGPDGQIVFDLVAEITQLRTVRNGEERFEYHGGCTLILGPMGDVRYAVLKSVVGENRLERRREFLRGAGRQFWDLRNSTYVQKDLLFRLLHDGAANPPCTLKRKASSAMT